MIRTFPNFTRVGIENKAEYESLIKDLPAFGDYAFASIMTWWNSLDGVCASRLNDNLVIQYWRPGLEHESGLSLVGTNRVDESICTLFDHLQSKDQPVRLAHVPEFVLHEINFPDLFVGHEERNYNEYVIPADRFYPLENMNVYRQRKVTRFLGRIGPENLEVKSLDLSNPQNKETLRIAAHKWWSENINDYGQVEKEAFEATIDLASEINLHNLCFFVHGHLHGFALFTLAADGKHAILWHLKATHRSMLRFELMFHYIMRHLDGLGYTHLNINNDEGLLDLRMFLLTLGPSYFFRKYRLEPTPRLRSLNLETLYQKGQSKNHDNQ